MEICRNWLKLIFYTHYYTTDPYKHYITAVNIDFALKDAKLNSVCLLRSDDNVGQRAAFSRCLHRQRDNG